MHTNLIVGIVTHKMDISKAKPFPATLSRELARTRNGWRQSSNPVRPFLGMVQLPIHMTGILSDNSGSLGTSVRDSLQFVARGGFSVVAVLEQL